jgi:hypothetical protein
MTLLCLEKGKNKGGNPMKKILALALTLVMLLGAVALGRRLAAGNRATAAP